MKRIISVLVLALVLFGLVGCGGERTYAADGTFTAWKLTTHEVTFEEEDYVVPSYVTVEVTIQNDEIVDFNIDERQGHAYLGTNRQGEEEVQIAFNDRTKKELWYEYNMEWLADAGEWFIQTFAIEREWLETGEIEAVSASTMTQSDYVEVAEQAIQNAKDGKVAAFHNGEHYDYDVVWVTGEIGADGKISNIAFDAQIFDTSAGKWEDETKYESYPEMAGGASWQDQLDTFTDYINENGWDGTINPNAEAGSSTMKGVNIRGEEVEALSSVTMEVKGQILVMNKLHNYFPAGF